VSGDVQGLPVPLGGVGGGIGESVDEFRFYDLFEKLGVPLCTVLDSVPF
jgi:hypothetical protein